MTLKELPGDDQSFAGIIDDNLLYADKTGYIYELLRGSKKKSYFLSRPRRFGKTLLLFTLAELFSGNRERFKGLWIDRSDYDFPRIPVLYLSLSQESESPAILKANLLGDLKRIADKANLARKVEGITPGAYFGNLVQALTEESKNEIAVLIDEYDAPVTRNMDNLKIATANAKILHDFFATLKKPEVSSLIRFTFITGITRYALTSMDSGPNQLNDLSMDPKYAGLCGFTLAEFDSLFADRLESTLDNCKKIGHMKSIETVEDLRAKIFRWYDGYNWGGETRVLNPYSILKFFKNNRFDYYWVKSGRPGPLTTLISQRPLDFVRPNLDSNLSRDVRKTELNNLEIAPVLFHSGYLTVDSIKQGEVADPVTGEPEIEDSYSFRFPNFEVRRSYYSDCSDCFRVVLSLPSSDALKTHGERLKQAFLARDAEAVSSMFSGFFSAISYYQRQDGEKAFHGLIHGILMAMGFKVRSEVSGSIGRLDLVVELSEVIFVVIELRYRRSSKKLSQLEENAALSSLALKRLKTEEVDEILADIAMKTFDITKKYQILS
ncbi:MAG: ATP-binding protein [Deltaproteobacteria bacterium]|jgi:hypothetical protein|nr:ATP-binding protein [Deltaproteobacteria bacterium]